jgi:hypothetical protein
MKTAVRLVGRALLAAAAAGGTTLALAHDSWLAAQGDGGLTMRTGERYPLATSAPPASSLAEAACVDGRFRAQPLQAGVPTPTALPLAVPTAAQGPLACWVALHEHTITLPPELVDVYFREIRPPQHLRAAWAAQHQDGLAWQERYRKVARIERSRPGDPPEALRAVRAPRNLPLEIVVDGDAPLRAGQPAGFRVLAQGRPVADLAVELVNERSPLGLWSRTDAQGRLRHVLPFAGTWLLRATLLEQDAEPGRWRSRFVTLAFDAAP